MSNKLKFLNDKEFDKVHGSDPMGDVATLSIDGDTGEYQLLIYLGTKQENVARVMGKNIAEFLNSNEHDIYKRHKQILIYLGGVLADNPILNTIRKMLTQ